MPVIMGLTPPDSLAGYTRICASSFIAQGDMMAAAYEARAGYMIEGSAELLAHLPEPSRSLDNQCGDSGLSSTFHEQPAVLDMRPRHRRLAGQGAGVVCV